ncbi:hypothetical protein QJS04_geneDACA009281 [Acorus gramineus]|uniref:Uncharacterized protein n=1 Tax=Acorus gramineus TaxID=55184 RepID=A0AAV9A2G9_ACOGR|nr:hypothetical protein QJS04_geneDACA009281 [Acorus gramineus]
MAVYVRTKRVTDPLDERVKACLRGEDHHRLMSSSTTSSNGSDHAISASLSDLLFHGFDDDDDSSPPDQSRNVDSDDEASEIRLPVLPSPDVMLRDLLYDPSGSDHFRLRLVEVVEEAVEALSALRSNESDLRRAVMGVLREDGYNAGVCKTRWESSGNLTAGNYEFIDVVVGSNGGGDDRKRRYIVDLEFAAEFKIARPTVEYGRVMEAMPRGVVVVEAEGLRRTVRAVAEAARRSMKERGLSLPPWRKARYAVAKWLGPYRRTTNATASVASMAVTGGRNSVGCRSVGFEAVVALRPPVSRTR